MERNVIARWRLLRRVVDDGRRGFRNYRSHSQTLVSAISSSSSSSSRSKYPSLTNAPLFHFPSPLSRSLCSPSDPSGIISIESEDQFNTSLSKAQDESLPAVFYFTATWCGPCRLVSPVIRALSKDYPQVAIYKIDVDQEGVQSTLSKLNIASVPTIHFFHNGKKAAEVTCADVEGIKINMEKLYN